jgi:hypothetical protein
VVPQRDFVSYLSSEWSIILVGLARLFPSFVGDNAETDNRFDDHEAMFAV